MSTYEYVRAYTDKKLKGFEAMYPEPDDISLRYARMTGNLEANIVSLLNFIRVNYGEEAFATAKERML